MYDLPWKLPKNVTSNTRVIMSEYFTILAKLIISHNFNKIKNREH